MKKNNKGFFLIESIVVISLVTIVMAYVYPNVAKLYDNFQKRAMYYDQTEDLYALKAYYNSKNIIITDETPAPAGKYNCTDILQTLNNGTNIQGIEGLSKVDMIKYIATPNSPSNYEYNKYLKRIKINSYDQEACRLIGTFTKTDIDGNNYTTYASIKIY